MERNNQATIIFQTLFFSIFFKGAGTKFGTLIRAPHDNIQAACGIVYEASLVWDLVNL